MVPSKKSAAEEKAVNVIPFPKEHIVHGPPSKQPDAEATDVGLDRDMQSLLKRHLIRKMHVVEHTGKI